MSLARRHYQRTIAAEANTSTDDVTPAYANAYELMLAQLTEHRRRLHEIQSVERKADAKAQFLPEYQPWVEGVLGGDAGRQDDVLMTVMVWRIDTGDYAGAITIAEYALAHGLTLPDQYKRDVATLVAEEIAEKALSAQSAGGEFDSSILANVAQITANRDMPDEVRAKLYKALGLSLSATDRQQALEHLRRALQLNERVGVKKDIERIERELKNAGTTG